jgi:hypothetical protein
MSPLTHLLIAWIVANIFSLNLKERRFCMIMGVIADIDGVFTLFSQDLFIKYHHTLGHWLVFGIPLALIFTVLSENKKSSFGAYSLAFSLHLIADIVGSGWQVHPFMPLVNTGFSAYPTLSVEMIYSVINPAVFIGVVLISLYILFKQRRTPLEFVSKRWDRVFSNFFVLPFKEKCSLCGKRAFFICESCKKSFCMVHAGAEISVFCPDCRKRMESN